MKKRRLTVKLENDEAAVVAPLHFWQGIEDHFKAMQKEVPNQYKEGWDDAIQHISYWVEKTKDTRSLSEQTDNE